MPEECWKEHEGSEGMTIERAEREKVVQERVVQEKMDLAGTDRERLALEKEAALLDWLSQQGAVAVAFSGGVDSAYLAWAVDQALGSRSESDPAHGCEGEDRIWQEEKMLAITACAHSYPERELKEAKALAEQIGIPHELFVFDEFQVPGFSENPPDRCYHCKTAILSRIKEIAESHGITCVIEGSNADDEGDYRPGARAIREQGVQSPLKEFGFTKAEIRLLSRKAGLPTWNKQSAACLASRFAYGEPITRERLRMAELAEEYLRQQGLLGQLRVRVHGNLARLELAPEQMKKLLDAQLSRQIAAKLKEIGFTYVTLDLQGYRMGSMNEELESK